MLDLPPPPQSSEGAEKPSPQRVSRYTNKKNKKSQYNPMMNPQKQTILPDISANLWKITKNPIFWIGTCTLTQNEDNDTFFCFPLNFDKIPAAEHE